MKQLLLLIFLGMYNMVFAQDLIPLSSPTGGNMLISSISSGYGKQFLSEVKYFTYQINTSFCGVATAVIVLNTLDIAPPKDSNFGKYALFTQNNLLTSDPVNKAGFSESSIRWHGLTLIQETQLLNANKNVKAVSYSTESLSEEQTKKIILAALKSESQLVVANILRSSMQESGGGHISPVSAYDPKSDSILFMDVASFKQYGPTWIPFHVFYNGMHTKDSNLYRGFIIVSSNN